MMAALWLAGCGDPLVSGQYRGTPLLQVEGNLYATSQEVLEQTRDKDIKVTLFWAASRQQYLRDLSLIAEQGVLTEADLPARYRLTAFSPPQLQPEDPTQTQWWIGLILLYEDSDHDGTWDGAGEALVGGATGQVLVYATAPWAPQELAPYITVTGGQTTLPAGYTLMDVSQTEICPAQGQLLALQVSSPEAMQRVDLALSLDPTALLPDVDCDAQPSDWDLADTAQTNNTQAPDDDLDDPGDDQDDPDDDDDLDDPDDDDLDDPDDDDLDDPDDDDDLDDPDDDLEERGEDDRPEDGPEDDPAQRRTEHRGGEEEEPPEEPPIEG
jgi:hypothetical protein